MDVVAKLRQHGKKDQPLKLLCNIKMALTLPIFFFWKMPKNWVSRMMLHGEKKGDGLTVCHSDNSLIFSLDFDSEALCA